MNMQRSLVYSALAVALLAGNSVAANDELVPGESILDRERPELDPLGMRLRAFQLYPRVDVDAEYESNIFALDRDEIHDVILKTSPGITLESDWVRHAIKLDANGVFAEYQENVQEDYEDYDIAADLTLDLSSASRLRLSGVFRGAHEERDSPDDVNGVTPTEYDEEKIAAVFLRRVGKVSLRAGAGQTRTDFDDVQSSRGLINNDDRDRSVYRYSLRMGYEIRPDIDAFLQPETLRRDYDNKPDDDGVNRDSRESRIALGLQGALTGSTYVEILGGNTHREYDDPRLEDDVLPWFEGRLIWNPSGLTTFTLNGLRQFDETTIAGATETISTRVGLRVDHELRRNLLLYVNSFVETEEYSGIGRTDDNFQVALGARYLVNRSFQIALDARQRSRDSNAANEQDIDFTNNSVMVSFRAHR